MTSAYDAGSVPEIKVHHRLRIAREAAGLDQAQLSELTGISRQSISAAESGRTAPRKVTLNAWALATGVPVSWITTGQVPPGSGPDDDPRSGPDLLSERSTVQTRQGAQIVPLGQYADVGDLIAA